MCSDRRDTKRPLNREMLSEIPTVHLCATTASSVVT
jgi:hypothetical protein